MPRYEDPRHTIEVTVIKGCREGERLCTQHCQEPCEDELEVEILDHGGCPVNLSKDRTYRCQTEHDLSELWGDADWADLGEGTHEVYAWTDGPDYWGEYDGGVEVVGP